MPASVELAFAPAVCDLWREAGSWADGFGSRSIPSALSRVRRSRRTGTDWALQWRGPPRPAVEHLSRNARVAKSKRLRVRVII